MKLRRRLLRHQPADEKERAADEEQAHFHRYVVFQQAGEQADREDDHPDQLEEATEERGHRRSVTTAARVPLHETARRPYSEVPEDRSRDPLRSLRARRASL